jgi:hypothetical protein
MPEREFIFWPHVDLTLLHAPGQLGARHRLQLVTLVQVAAQNPLDLADITRCHFMQSREHSEHLIVSQPVKDKLPLPSRLHEPIAVVPA